MNVEKYIKDLSEMPLGYLIASAVIVDLDTKVIDAKYLEAIMKEISRICLPLRTATGEGVSAIEKYLITVQERATPAACKAAKKSQLAYMEQCIYKDEKAATITANEATAAKLQLPHFLTKNKTDDKEKG